MKSLNMFWKTLAAFASAFIAQTVMCSFTPRIGKCSSGDVLLLVFWVALFVRCVPPVVAKRLCFAMSPFFACIGLLYSVFTSSYEHEVVPFSGKKVLVLVPHQDDELNLTSGVLDVLTKENDVHFVFSTNGDRSGVKKAEMRAHEVERLMTRMNIPLSHVGYLGYGDGWPETNGVSHLYDAAPDAVMTSYAGRMRTYGAGAFSPVRPGVSYTRDHYAEDLKQAISDLRPDVIICVDFDSHPDHRALSLTAEACLGEIFRSCEYRPCVLKAFAYSPSWCADEDFYAPNPVSSRRGASFSQGTEMEENGLCRWDERIRIPVAATATPALLLKNSAFHQWRRYASQSPRYASVINGDKVFWKRRTDSLLYSAHVQADGEDGDQLTDFRIIDASVSRPKPNFNHGWKLTNGRGTAVIRLRTPEKVSVIRLYDNPNPNDQVLSYTIETDGGDVFRGEALPANGAPVTVNLKGEREISEIVLRVERSVGDTAGIAEVEAFRGDDAPLRICKLTDDRGDFMYDYVTSRDGDVSFSVYHTVDEAFRVVDESGEELNESDGLYRLRVPVGRERILSAYDSRNRLVDKVRIRNPGRLRRFAHSFLQCVDRAIVRDWTYVEKRIHKWTF